MLRPLAVVALFATYFPTAIWLQLSWDSPVRNSKVAVRLHPPFERAGATAVVARRWLPEGTKLDDGDRVEGDIRSPLLIYEDGRLLGPAHSTYADIEALGHGRYLHWDNKGIIFSASDNSDPNRNGRRYVAVVP
jgi:hypothetical protein